MQAALKARDEKQERCLAEVADERRHIAEERVKARRKWLLHDQGPWWQCTHRSLMSLAIA
jgi:ribonuclease D